MTLIKKIPIIIITKDEPRFLRLMVNSIVKRTNFPYELYVVDNGSKDEEQKKMLLWIESCGYGKIFYGKNQWVLGFNLPLKSISVNPEVSDDYIVMSDGDIIVPIAKDKKCWLEYLVEKMEANRVVGKLGYSLDLGYIREKKSFESIVTNELYYRRTAKISELNIAPVDTTLAIYRKNLFVMNSFLMQPGHMSLMRPYYYCCRTPIKWSVKHLGWRNYESPVSDIALTDKVICFSKYACFVEKMMLEKVALKARLYYRFLKPLSKMFWGSKVVIYWVIYFLKKFPRDLNEIQSSFREKPKKH